MYNTIAEIPTYFENQKQPWGYKLYIKIILNWLAIKLFAKLKNILFVKSIS